jgi:hypothetical protein
MRLTGSQGVEPDQRLGGGFHCVYLWMGARSVCYYSTSTVALIDKVLIAARTWMEDLCCKSMEWDRCSHYRVSLDYPELGQSNPRLYIVYLPLRLYGVAKGDDQINDYALSVLSCESSLLFPRLAFWFLAGNVLVM